MSVNNINQAQHKATTQEQNKVQANGSSGSDLNNMFMTLLVAQIQNQDPLNPTDGTEYVSQLAQMTQVQSMENMSSMMRNNAVLMDNLQVLSTAGLVGQQVMVQSDQVQLTDQPAEGRLTLEHNANVVALIVKDAAGVQHKLDLGAQDKGVVNFVIDPQKMGLAPGTYSLSAVTDVDEKEVPIEMAGLVNNVRIPLGGGSALIDVTGLGEIPFYQISQFSGSSAANTRI